MVSGPCHARNASNESAVVRVLSADADFVGLACHSSVSDIDIVTARGEIHTGLTHHGDIDAAGYVAKERLITIGRVAEAGSIVEQRLITHCRVEKGQSCCYTAPESPLPCFKSLC